MKNSKTILIGMLVILSFAFFAMAMAQSTSTSMSAGTQNQSGITTPQSTQTVAKPIPPAKPAVAKQVTIQSTGTTAVQPATAPKVVKSDVKSSTQKKAAISKQTAKKVTQDTARKAKVGANDITTTLIGMPDAKIFTTDLEKSGLFPMLRNTGPFTVFVPSDSAFGKLSQSAKDSLENDMPRLVDVLKYHIVHGMQDEAMLLKTSTVKTTDRRDVMIMNHGGKLMVGNAWVIKADIKCSNGVIHIIDSVLEPPMKAEAAPIEKSGGMAPSGK